MNAQDWLLIETEVSSAGTEITLGVVGDVDLATASQLAAAVYDAAAHPGVERIAVDLGEVAFLSSTGVGTLLRCKQELEAGGLDFGLTRVGPAPLRTLELSGVAALLALPDPTTSST